MRIATLRTDPAWRTLPWLALGGAAIGALTTIPMRGMLARGGDVFEGVEAPLAIAPLMQLLIVSWSTAFWFGARDRVDEMRLALPVRARAWFGERAAVMLLVGWLPLACAALAVAVVARSAAMLETIVAAGGAGALSWAAWVALCFAWRPARTRLDSTPFLVAITVAAAALAWTGLLSPALGAALSLAVLVPAAIVAWRGVPEAIELDGGCRASTGQGASASPAQPFHSPERLLRRWVVRRSWWKGRAALIPFVIALFLLFRPMPPGFVYAYATYLAWLVMTSSLRVLRDVGHLPIPRARLASHVLVPTLLAFVIGGTGDLLLEWRRIPNSRRDEVDLGWRDWDGGRTGRVDGEPCVEVPGALLRPVLGTGPRVVTSPSGESATVVPIPLVPGLPLAIVNPYDIDARSSIDFVAWQLSRALRDAYGIEVEPDELRERTLHARDGVVSGSLNWEFFARHPAAHAVPHPGRAGWVAAVLALIWTFAAWAGTLPNAPAADPARRRRGRLKIRLLQAGSIGAIAAAMFQPFLWIQRGLPSLEDAFAARCLEAVGGREWILPAAALALAGLAYRLAVRRIERLEVPPPLRRTWYRSV